MRAKILNLIFTFDLFFQDWYCKEKNLLLPYTWISRYHLSRHLCSGLSPLQWTVIFAVDCHLRSGLSPLQWTVTFAVDCHLGNGLSPICRELLFLYYYSNFVLQIAELAWASYSQYYQSILSDLTEKVNSDLNFRYEKRQFKFFLYWWYFIIK